MRIQYFQSTHNTCSIFCWHTPLNLSLALIRRYQCDFR